MRLGGSLPPPATSIVVCTAAIGPGADPLHAPTVIAPGVRYYCAIEHGRRLPAMLHWQPISIPLLAGDPVLTARQFKIRLHTTVQRIAPTCTAYLWIDAAYELQIDPAVVLTQAGHGDLAVLVHPHRSSIVDEAQAIASRRKPPFIAADILQPQVARYLADRYPDRSLSTTGLLIRRNDARTAAFNERWWTELTTYGHTRDQMSFDYAAWKTGMTITYLTGHYRANPYAFWHHYR